MILSLKTKLTFAVLFFFTSALFGQNWVTYTQTNTKGLTGNIITSITQDHQGNFWFGTDAGIVKYDVQNHLWPRYANINNTSIPTFVYKVATDAQGHVWACTNNGLGVFNTAANNWTVLTQSNGLPGNIIRDIIFTGTSTRKWVASHGNGAGYFDGGSWQTYNVSNGLAGNIVYSLGKGFGSDIWIGTSSGLSKFDGTHWTTYKTTNGLPSNTIIAIAMGNNNDMWFGTPHGACVFNGSQWQVFNTQNGLSGNMVFDIFKDASSHIWFATDNGITRFDGTQWYTFNATNGPASDTIYSIFQDDTQKLWFGLEREGVSVFNGQSWSNIKQTTGLLTHNVKAIVQDKWGHHYMGTSLGISKFQNGQWTSFTSQNGNLPSNQIYAATKAENGNLWFATAAGAVRYNGYSWTTFNSLNGLPSSMTHYIFKDKQGVLWFGTSQGLSKYQYNIFYNYTSSNGLFDNVVRIICQDGQNRLWIYHHGSAKLSVMENNSFQHIERPLLDGNPVVVNAIFADNSGIVWALTSYGPYKYNLTSHTWEKFAPLEWTYTYNMAETQDGSLWFGTHNRLIRFKNGSITNLYSLSGVLPAYIQHIYADDDGYLWVVHNNGISKGDVAILSAFPGSPNQPNNIRCYPNPFSENIQLEIDVHQHGHVGINIFDLNGRLVMTVDLGALPAGNHLIPLMTKELHSGVYMAVIYLKNTIYGSAKLIKTT